MPLTSKDVILVIGSTMRLTRLVVTDDIGAWWVKWPAYGWAKNHHPLPPPRTNSFGMAVEEEFVPTWRDKLVLGLDCPFCVGTWIGFAVLAITALTPPNSAVGRLWRFVMAGLGLNYVTAHISSRLDAEPDED